MDRDWTLIIDILQLAIFIGLASYLKRRFKFFKKYLIPIPILAGFIGFFLGDELLGLVTINKNQLGELVYHLMAIGFIGLSLQNREKKRNKAILNAGAYIVSTYLIQGIVGFCLSLGLFYTYRPDLFPMFGLLLPLSFGQGPGQAYSIGSQWEKLGFINGGNIGLTFATIGFLWASFAGLYLLNYLIRKNKYKINRRAKHHIYKVVPRKMEYRESTSNESLDTLTTQLFLIAIVYFVTYLTLRGMSHILAPMGTLGMTLSQLLWGFHFIIGSLYGMLIKFFINYARKNNKKLYFNTDKFLLQRVTGGVFDFMITASIAAISIYSLQNYLVPLLLITTAGGIITMVYTYFMCQRVFKVDHLENILGFYGMQTGTVSSGMALLKVVDPNLDTSATDNLVMGSAVAIFYGFPLMVILSLPVVGYTTGRPIYYLISILAFFAYLGFLYLIIFRRNLSAKLKK